MNEDLYLIWKEKKKDNFDLCVSVCLTVNEENGQEGGCLFHSLAAN